MKRIYVWDDKTGKRFHFSTKAKLNAWIKELAKDVLSDSPNSTLKDIIKRLSSSQYVYCEEIE